MVTKLNKILNSVPSNYTKKSKQEEWFANFICELQNLNLSDIVHAWAVRQCELNPAFEFWYFIYRRILEPLIILYMSVRLSHFDGILIDFLHYVIN